MQVTQILDLSAEIRASLKSLRGILSPDARIEDCIPGAPVLVRVDRAGLTQVLTKLVINAAQAMGNRGVVTVSLGDGSVNVPAAKALDIERGAYALLSVADTGCGIAPELMPRLFEPCFTAKPGGPRMPNGLAIAHGIVRDWNGALTVQSTVGLGTIFTLYIPLLQPAQIALKHAC